jgi:LysR family transcriptional regulator of gallate degradation
LSGRKELSLDDVRQYPFAFPSLPSRVSLPLIGKNGAPGLELPAGAAAPQIRAETAFLARCIVMESDALSAAVPCQIASEIASGRLVALPLALPWLETNYGIIRRADRTASPAAVAFMQILRDVEAAIA